ncbi:MAG TPA: hypothetical protein VFX50_11555, partial [Gemmatimonadales bacterium]|nr:hypothetical protein [Gemmatimonadales bacterium]
DVSVLLRAAAVRANQGDRPGAIAYLERARELDPRSPVVLRVLTNNYTAVGRFRDAVASGDVLASVIPADVAVAGSQVEAYLRIGDQPGARAAVKAAVQRGVPMPELAARLIGTQERGWVLEEADQQLALRLTPSAFDGERDWWAQSLATLHWQRGDTAMARVYADSALAPTRAVIARTAAPSQQDGLLGLMLAYLGRAAEAREASARGRQDANEGMKGYALYNSAKAELALGNRAAALDYLEQMVPLGAPELPAILRFDPSYRSLKGDPRYERLLQPK